MTEWRVTGPDVPPFQDVDQAVQQYMQQNGVPNGAVAIARDGRLVFTRGYTWADPSEETTSPTSLFRIASCTKPMTRVGIYRLIESGALQPSSNVQNLLQLVLPNGAPPQQDPQPSSPNTPGQYFTAVTVGHLLLHQGGWDRSTSGFNEPTFFHDPDAAQAFNTGLPVTRMEIARWGVGQPMQFWPGSRSAYSNFGFSLLGLVIEQATGQDYIAWMSESIFAPLGVVRPRLSMPLERSRAPGEVAYHPVNPALKPDLVSGTGTVPIQYGGENNANFASFGGWIMSAPDYVRVLASYAPGQPSPTRTLPRDMLGCPRATRGGVGCSEHGGSLPGTSTYIGLRDDDIALAIFFNMDAPSTFQWAGGTANLIDVVHQLMSNLPVPKWPTDDLFPSVMTAPVPPGPEKLNVYVTGNDGVVSEASWEQNVAGATWRGWWQVREAIVRPGQPASVVARDPNKLDIFLAGQDGRTYTAAWDQFVANAGWRGWWNILTGWIVPGGAVTAVSRDPNKLDIFLVSNDGGVYTAAWDQNAAGGAWQGWWRIGDLVAQPGSSVAAVARRLA